MFCQVLGFLQNLYRKTPGLTQKEGTKPENASKNRYLDILPCEFTCASSSVIKVNSGFLR